MRWVAALSGGTDRPVLYAIAVSANVRSSRACSGESTMLSACHWTAIVKARSVAWTASMTPSVAQPTARSPSPRTSIAWW